MISESLSKILSTIEYQEFEIEILNLTVSTPSLKLNCLVKDTEGTDGQTTISISAFGWKNFDIEGDSRFTSNIRLEDNHPLLWKFNDTQCDLYISGGKPSQFEKVVFDLLQIHNSIFGKVSVFDFHVVNILNSGYGLLKKDSDKLLTEFANCLERNGVPTTIINQSGSSKQDNLSKILFIGDCYVIADKFEFEIVDMK